jgi:hypothetical protein
VAGKCHCDGRPTEGPMASDDEEVTDLA